MWVRHVFIADSRWVAAGGPLVAFGLAWLLTTRYALRTERQMRDFVYGALGRYVSADIADQVFRNVALMRPQRREVTLCYADLEAFRALDQALPPEAAGGAAQRLLRRAHPSGAPDRRTRGVRRGRADRLLGSAGAPGAPRRGGVPDRPGDPSELARLGPEWQRRFGADVRARMALHTGRVVAGDMGSTLKSNYTVLGEPVAVVGRLERANRLYGTSILASEDTVRRAGDEFVFRELDQVSLNGGDMTLHELIGRPEEVPAALLPVLAGWPQALAQVRRREFAPALAFFQSHADVDPVSLPAGPSASGGTSPRHPRPTGTAGGTSETRAEAGLPSARWSSPPSRRLLRGRSPPAGSSPAPRTLALLATGELAPFPWAVMRSDWDAPGRPGSLAPTLPVGWRAFVLGSGPGGIGVTSTTTLRGEFFKKSATRFSRSWAPASRSYLPVSKSTPPERVMTVPRATSRTWANCSSSCRLWGELRLGSLQLLLGGAELLLRVREHLVPGEVELLQRRIALGGGLLGPSDGLGGLDLQAAPRRPCRRPAWRHRWRASRWPGRGTSLPSPAPLGCTGQPVPAAARLYSFRAWSSLGVVSRCAQAKQCRRCRPDEAKGPHC